MAFFFKFPYTNAYQLNLDWLMETVKRLEERIGEGVVESFNDRTGDVTLESEDVNALCINSVYVSDPGESVPTGDALNELFQDGVRIILLRDSEGFAKQLYTVDGTEEGAFATQFIPDISGSAVTTFNGRTGAVSLLVSDVNGLGIDITWTSDPGDSIEDLSQSDFNDMYAAGIRVLIFQDGEGNPDTLYMLMLIDNTPTPQAYTPAGGGGAVASVNGQTGVVVLYGTDIYMSNALGAGTVSAGIAANAAAIGTLSGLATSDKSSAVAAINEVNTVAGNALIAAQAAQSDATAAGTAAASAQTAAIAAGTAASTAQTTANSAATTAGNAATAAAAADSHVGTLANLTTTDKTSAVAAVNELNDQIANLMQNKVKISTFTTTFSTIEDASTFGGYRGYVQITSAIDPNFDANNVVAMIPLYCAATGAPGRPFVVSSDENYLVRINVPVAYTDVAISVRVLYIYK